MLLVQTQKAGFDEPLSQNNHMHMVKHLGTQLWESWILRE
jgi:hypothetical protein